MRKFALVLALIGTMIMPILAVYAATSGQTGPTIPGLAHFLPFIRRDPPPTPASTGPTIGGCPTFPADHIWNARVDSLPVHSSSGTWVNSIGAASRLKADFGAGLFQGAPIGIPYILVGAGQTPVSVSFEVDDESDPGPYPIPPNAPIEGGGDHHVLVVDTAACKLYEIFAAEKQSDTVWRGYSGAVFDLRAYALRPLTWTSADAAGLAMPPGLARYDEILTGEIKHALRFTAAQTRNQFVWPARHQAGSNNANLPPMGARFRLKADFNISGFSATNRILLTAMKRYGLMLADNGSAWFVSGAPDERWNNDDLQILRQIPGSAFEAVDVSSLMKDPNSGQVK